MAKNTLLLMAIISTLLFLPFIVCSLYYGYQDTSCASTAVTKFSIAFDLGTWLKVDGFTDVGFIGIFLLLGVGSMVGVQIGQNVGTCGFISIVIYCIFKGIWMIIGAILYWGDIGQTGLCAGPIAAYTSARIVIGLILTIALPFLIVCMAFLGLSPRVFA